MFKIRSFSITTLFASIYSRVPYAFYLHVKNDGIKFDSTHDHWGMNFIGGRRKHLVAASIISQREEVFTHKLN